MRGAWLVVVVTLLGPGCYRSDTEIRAEFDAFVAMHNECAANVADECVLASADCPLGCFAAVNAKHKAAVERKASDLVSEYERWGRHCDNDCAFGKAMCVEGRCTFVFE